MAQTNLEKLEGIIDSKFPSIKEFISSKEEHKIEIEVPYNTGYNWKNLNDSCSHLFSGSFIDVIKNRTVTFNEKHSYFKVTLHL